MNILLKIIKLPLKIIAIPAALCLFLANIVCAILIGLSSMVTNIAAGLFLFGSAAGWIAGANAVQIWHCVGIGLFFLLAPHIANWIISAITNTLYSILGFISH